MHAASANEVTQLQEQLAQLSAERDESRRERDEYKKLYLEMLALCRKLELGLVGQQRERFTGAGDTSQLTMPLLGMLGLAPVRWTV